MRCLGAPQACRPQPPRPQRRSRGPQTRAAATSHAHALPAPPRATTLSSWLRAPAALWGAAGEVAPLDGASADAASAAVAAAAGHEGPPPGALGAAMQLAAGLAAGLPASVAVDALLDGEGERVKALTNAQTDCERAVRMHVAFPAQVLAGRPAPVVLLIHQARSPCSLRPPCARLAAALAHARGVSADKAVPIAPLRLAPHARASSLACAAARRSCVMSWRASAAWPSRPTRFRGSPRAGCRAHWHSSPAQRLGPEPPGGATTYQLCLRGSSASRGASLRASASRASATAVAQRCAWERNTPRPSRPSRAFTAHRWRIPGG